MDRVEVVTMELAEWMQSKQYRNGEALAACLIVGGCLATQMRDTDTSPEKNSIPDSVLKELRPVALRLFQMGPTAVSTILSEWGTLIDRNIQAPGTPTPSQEGSHGPAIT